MASAFNVSMFFDIGSQLQFGFHFLPLSRPWLPRGKRIILVFTQINSAKSYPNKGLQGFNTHFLRL